MLICKHIHNPPINCPSFLPSICVSGHTFSRPPSPLTDFASCLRPLASHSSGAFPLPARCSERHGLRTVQAPARPRILHDTRKATFLKDVGQPFIWYLYRLTALWRQNNAHRSLTSVLTLFQCVWKFSWLCCESFSNFFSFSLR